MIKYFPTSIPFSITDRVYLICDTEQLPGIVTGVIVRRDSYTYLVTWGDREETNHHSFELSKEKQY